MQLVLETIILWSLIIVPAASQQTRSKSKDVDPVEAIFSPDRTVSAASQAKRTRVPTRWPMDATWITDLTAKASSVATGKIESDSNGHTPLADNIKCSSKGLSESFTAVISQPFGFANVPLFEDAVNTLNPTVSEECQMKPSGGTFLMKINDFNKCGVTTQKGSDGKEWLSVSIVFPYVGGLRTSDDEHVMIMCKPQDRMASKSHIIDYRPNMPHGPKAIYSSPSHELDTKIVIYTRKSTAGAFTEELSRNALIEVGQELQFRAIVRPGDGWKFAKLKDLTIQRSAGANVNTASINNDSKSRVKSGDTAYLVMEDGCRNPVYAAIAEKHPSVDKNNPLVVNFVFKAFMFQNMADGDTLRISAKIVACQELADCQPTICVDDDLHGHGRRRRRRSLPHSSDHLNHFTNPLAHSENYSSSSSSSSNCTHNWTRDYELSVVMPGFSRNRIESTDWHVWQETVRILQSQDHRCKNVIFATSLICVILMVTTALVAIIALKSKDNKSTKFSSHDSLSQAPSVSSSFTVENVNRERQSSTPVLLATSFLKSSVRGLHTRIHNTSI